MLSPPQETAGVIIKGQYQPRQNKSPTPQRAFALDPLDLSTPGLEAIVHSHPGGPACPSREDMQQQIVSGLPWVIATVPTAASPCLEDIFIFGLPPRLNMTCGYRHGVDDCYSLIRGFYADEMGCVLPEIPRGWNWWHEGGDHYMCHYERLGFTPLAAGIAPRRGDVFLAQIRSPVINHGGIWLGEGLILHHLAGRKPHDPLRLPRKEPSTPWHPFIKTWLRYHPESIKP